MSDKQKELGFRVALLVAFAAAYCWITYPRFQRLPAPKFPMWTNSAGEVYPLYTGEVGGPVFTIPGTPPPEEELGRNK